MFEPLEPREHGDHIARTAGSGVVDFSVNLNPYGPTPGVLRAARCADFSAYPDSTGLLARTRWAEQLSCEPDEIVLGHGAAELLWHVARVVLRPGDRCGVLAPTFSEAEAAARAAGARVRTLRASAERDFVHDLADLAEPASQCRLVYLCTPNNPTGRHVRAEDISTLARACPHTTLVVDQSFLALSDHADELAHAPEANVACVRSLTKEHTLAGLRIGYARCHADLARALETRRASWSTSAPAQAALVRAAEETRFVQACWVAMRKDRDELARELRHLGLRPLASATGFQLVPVPHARALTERLLERYHIAVRDCSSFGLPGYIRLAARPAADRKRLVRALSLELR